MDCSQSQPPSTQRREADSLTPTAMVLPSCLADRLKDFQRIAHSVLQRTAVLVAALVAERREKLVQQIAVGGVQFNQLKAQPLARSALATKAALMRARSAWLSSAGRAIAIVKRHGGRGDGLPATIVERQLMASPCHGAAQDALRPA